MKIFYYFLVFLLVTMAVDIYAEKNQVQQEKPEISVTSAPVAAPQEFKIMAAPLKAPNFSDPIIFNKTGIETFFKDIYNTLEYADFLANNFSHMIQCLTHGGERALPLYAKSIMKMFGNKLKATSYINTFAFTSFLDQLPIALSPYIQASKVVAIDLSKKQINDVLYNSFLTKFDQLKQNPESFFNNLSDDLLALLQGNAQTMNTDLVQLRHAIVKFLEICLSKLVWSPQDYSTVWPSVKTIAQQLTLLMDKNIITEADDLDDLYWTLTHRFCFFVDLMGIDLPLAFYEDIKDDMQRENPLFCSLEEQEKLIMSKAEYLQRTLVINEARVRSKMLQDEANLRALA